MSNPRIHRLLTERAIEQAHDLFVIAKVTDDDYGAYRRLSKLAVHDILQRTILDTAASASQTMAMVDAILDHGYIPVNAEEVRGVLEKLKALHLTLIDGIDVALLMPDETKKERHN